MIRNLLICCTKETWHNKQKLQFQNSSLHVGISPNRNAAEALDSEELINPGLGLHRTLVVVGYLVDDGAQEVELLLSFQEVVDEGA
jgi:hypothetical protein